MSVFFSLQGILTGSKSYGQEIMTVVRPAETGIPPETIYTYINDNSWKYEVEDFAKCIVEDKSVTEGNSLDALKSMSLVYEIYKADQEWAKKFNL